MNKITNKKLIVGIEIGITKIVTLIGEVIDNIIRIIGIGYTISKGIDTSGINDFELVTSCIKKSILKAESMAGCYIHSTYLAISSKYINCQDEMGLIPISKKMITLDDINNVIHIAKCVRIKNKHNIIHVIPQEYAVDKQFGIKNPIGLSGIRMQVKVHLITCHQDISKNIIKAVEMCGIKVDQLIFSGVASSEATLTKEEQDIGSCLIDMGGGTMDINLFHDGAIVHSEVIPYAGEIVTNDISHAFSISIKDAEHIKTKYGSLQQNSINNDTIEIFDKNKLIKTKNLTKYKLVDIIKPRYTELLDLVKQSILNIQNKMYYQNNTIFNLRAGIILTGGASKIDSLINCAKKIFNTKVRIAAPYNIKDTKNKIYKPEFSTVTGLLLYANNRLIKEKHTTLNKVSFKLILKKINNWFKKEF